VTQRLVINPKQTAQYYRWLWYETSALDLKYDEVEEFTYQ
jgi:hypothetical protein